jgi:macrodomain Ter protein organizer (MatP/YcbG family)
MAKTTLPVKKAKVTIEMSATVWNRFKKKARKAELSGSERVRQLIVADLKV